MNTIEQLTALFTELPDASEAVDLVTHDEACRWTVVAMDYQLSLQAMCDEQGERLTLRTYFPTPKKAARKGTYETMLLINGGAADASGLRLALDESGTPLQAMDVSTANLDLMKIRSAIEFFVTKAVLWTLITARTNLEDGGESTQAINQMTTPFNAVQA